MILGKEYVCIVRLHEAIDKVADLAKVSTHSMHLNLRVKVLINFQRGYEVHVKGL